MMSVYPASIEAKSGRTWIWFAILCIACVGGSLLGQMVFPGEAAFPKVTRLVLTAVGTVILAVGSERLLRARGDGIGLGLRPSPRTFAGFLAGSVGGFVVVAIIAGALWLVVPFHLERGPLPTREILPRWHGYFWGNFGEELIFRGYLLVVLSKAWGRPWALLALAVAFGLFHLPGLSGIEAVKMVMTTAACSYLFSAAFLATGTLWTAVGLHVAMNVALHTISGLDGAGGAVLKPVFDAPWPSTFDAAFSAFLAVTLVLALVLFRLNRDGRQTGGVRLDHGPNFKQRTT